MYFNLGIDSKLFEIGNFVWPSSDHNQTFLQPVVFEQIFPFTMLKRMIAFVETVPRLL